jgi:acetolactate synthase I/II/III large subunit
VNAAASPHPATDPAESSSAPLTGHAGTLALAAAQAYGIDTLFTLSGAHIFPLYDAAVSAQPPVRLVDVRHEQSAVFAAEATAKITRKPGLAAVTAGPGVTNAISAVTQAYSSGVPLLVLGGRAPAFRWGSGALQELDHPPLLAPVTKAAMTAATAGEVFGLVDQALRIAAMPHRGPTFVDVPMDQLYSHATVEPSAAGTLSPIEPDPDAIAAIARLLAAAQRPVLVIGSDVWMEGAENSVRAFVDTLAIPVIANGMGRGIVPPGHPALVTKARSTAFGSADLVVVAGAPLDFRLQYGSFGAAEAPAQVVHLADAPSQVASHVPLAGSATGWLHLVFERLRTAWEEQPQHADRRAWSEQLSAAVARTQEQDHSLLRAEAANGLHPARVYGALLPELSDDTILVADGGDFVSWAGKFVEPQRPGGWLDPGPYGCLGAGLGAATGAAIARPGSPVVLLLGDGAAGFALADIDTLVRHELPVLIIVGNNGAWGLEKHPMRMLYGYDVVADLRRDTRYDAISEAMGGGGETVADPTELPAALRRGLASSGPYVVNVLLDPEVAYPRKTTGI